MTTRLRSQWRILAGVAVLVAVAAVTLRPGSPLEDGAGAGSGASPSAAVAESLPSSTPTPSLPTALPTASLALSRDELAFAEAYLALASTHDQQATDLLIANPLAEFDLVGARLIDLVEESRRGLAGLPALHLTADRVRAVDRELVVTLELLRAVDPHGPPADKATQYQRALDYWVEHVQPASDAIRTAVGLAPSATGDLRL